MMRRAVVVALLCLPVLGACITVSTEDDCAEKKLAACVHDQGVCEELERKCGWKAVEHTLVSACVDGGAKECASTLRHYREGVLSNARKRSAKGRARAVTAACAHDPAVVCELVKGRMADNPSSYREALTSIEAALACDAEKAQSCVKREGLKLIRSVEPFHATKPFGPRTAAWLAAACKAGDGKACAAALTPARHALGAAATPTTEQSELMRAACRGGVEEHCTLIGETCMRPQVSCDEATTRKLLDAHCKSAACLGAAALYLPDVYGVRACAAGHEDSCSRTLHDDTKAKAVAEALRARCGDAKKGACLRRAGDLLRRGGKPRLALRAMRDACDARDAPACDWVPYVALEAGPPASRAGAKTLDTRCTSTDGKACFALAHAYKYGTGVGRVPSKSKHYAAQACKVGKGAPYHHDACHWTPVSTGEGAFNTLLRKIGLKR